MRIIFSRKGFDSGAGGVPSPILDGTAMSLPIPTRQRSTKTFGDLGLGDIVRDLTRGKINASHLCHHDPDLEMGALGQVGSAQSHLRKCGVCAGDLFLFWGLFRPVERVSTGYRYVPGAPKEHRIFAWLQVGEVVDLGPDGTWAAEKNPKLAEHPHCSPGWNDNNTLYLADGNLRIGAATTSLPGAGTFTCASDTLRLTTPGGLTSIWTVPSWLNPKKGGTGMTYHAAPERWGEDTLQTVGRGQEFVATVDGRSDVAEWLEMLFAEARP